MSRSSARWPDEVRLSRWWCVLGLFPVVLAGREVFESQVTKLTGVHPKRAYVDRGYRGHNVTSTQLFISGQRRGVTPTIRKELRRRSAIEANIGHQKNDGRLGRNFLRGAFGDQANAILCAIGSNLRLLLRWLRSLFAWILTQLIGGYRAVRTSV